MGSSYDEEAAIFFLELLIRVVLQNRYGVQIGLLPVGSASGAGHIVNHGVPS